MPRQPDQVDETYLIVQSALVGEYSLERELGRGGMGIVYLAREVRLDRLVAIKVLPLHLAASDDLRMRFLRESQTAARLSHPNIVPIFRVGEVGEVVYFAMGYVEGETLTDRVRARGPLPVHEAVRILREAAWALAYAHARGIVHRDVKPDNILLEQGSGRALLTDFGIAHVDASASVTEAGLVLGTAQYMSPEQAAGEKLDGRSDLYSLGVVAHFMLAGKVPFDDPSAAALLAKHLTQPAPALASVVPGLPRKIGDAIDRCLAKTPEERFATGEALAEALAAATEAPREIPAPIRVWIAKGHQGRGLGLFLLIYLSAAFVPLMVTSSAWFGFVPVGIIGLGLGLPAFFRTRRVLREGYQLEDLRAGLRMHWARRREELHYETVERSTFEQKALWTVGGLGILGAMGAAAAHSAGLLASPRFEITVLVSGALGAGALMLAGIQRLRRWRVGRAGGLNLKFWNSKWGERFLALARSGLQNVAALPAAPQLTEVAIGRATDVLYEALPAPVRRDLRELPATVRKLEADAHRLRGQIEELERHHAEMNVGPASRSLAAAAERDHAVVEGRDRVATELATARDMARERLASTVVALENIRLGLLRLQLGSAPVASVTAALEAAQRIAADVDRVADADEEVAKVLRPGPTLARR